MYTLFNSGSVNQFDPQKMVSDPNNRKLRTALDVNTDFVRTANSKSVFIVDHRGNVLEIK